ncbi:MAG: 30S ribosomal protein S3 [Christensenellaceae bacterium]|jgi:small subunit ribosomal protein S3|nr:30S ribosomal protein S3 [Christensenellaceae bacterium]
MGQKVSPVGFRMGVNKTWESLWYANKGDFAKFIKQDNDIRRHIKKKYYACAISKIGIERTAKRLVVNITTGRPGVLIGQKGAGVEALKKEVCKIADTDAVSINIKEVRNIDLDAVLIAEGIASQLEKRVKFRSAMKQAMQRATKAGAKGIKTMVSGRLEGADIARTEHYHLGNLPLHTLRADIDYGTAEAHTTFGIIGVKVWVYKGDILGKFSITPSANSRRGGGDNVNA